MDKNRNLCRKTKCSFYKFERNKYSNKLLYSINKHREKFLFLGAISCIVIILIPFFFVSCLKDYSEVFRNLILGLGAIIAFPFIVWRSINLDKNTKISQQSHEREVYVKAVEQIANDKEAIWLGGVMALKEIALNSKNKKIKERICDILYAFMEEHSRHDNSKKLIHVQVKGSL